MSFTLRAQSFFDAAFTNRNVDGGSRSKYKEFTIGAPKFDETKLLAVTSTWDAWGFSTEEPISDFDFACIETDLDGVLVELTCDKGNENGTMVFVQGIISGLPYFIPSNVSRALYTADFGSGVADVIDRIRIRNPNVSTAANVRLALFT